MSSKLNPASVNDVESDRGPWLDVDFGPPDIHPDMHITHVHMWEEEEVGEQEQVTLAVPPQPCRHEQTAL